MSYTPNPDYSKVPDITDEDDHYPKPILQVTLEEAPTIEANATLNQVKAADMIITNNVLAALHVAWGGATSVGQICNLAKTTMATIKERRHLLCLEYGNNNKTAGGGGFLDLD